MIVSQEFFTIYKFVKSVNATFFALIPRKSSVSEVKDFCSISLVNGVHR